MNPLSPHLMTPSERRAALCRLLALGLVRLHKRQSSELSDKAGDCLLHKLPDQRAHATPTQRRPA